MFEKSKKIGIFQLVLISVSAIVSLKSLPLFAEVGLSIIFFLSLATICFFIPIAMVIAELSSTWPNAGGCYLWVKKAYGESWAFMVMWAYWIEGIIWFPTMLIFITAMLAHALSPIFPNLENNSYFLISGIIIIFWLLTLLNFRGVKISALFSSFGVLLGTIIPTLLIISFGIYWLYNNHAINITLDMNSILPNFNINSLVFFSGILLGISGIELIAFYVNDVENPSKNMGKAVLLSSVFILVIYILGSLSIAIVVPKSDISLASGIIQALKIFFIKLNLEFITPFIAFLLLLGSLSGMNTWIIGPTKGLFVAASDGFLPKFLCYLNSENVPVNLLFFQAVIGSLLSIFFFLYINSINGLIWIFICLSFQFASFLYIMIFLSAIKLRKLYPATHRPYKAPFVKFFCSIGILMCVFTFLISYAQPIDINIINRDFYSLLLFIVFLILITPAICFILFKNKK